MADTFPGPIGAPTSRYLIMEDLGRGTGGVRTCRALDQAAMEDVVLALHEGALGEEDERAFRLQLELGRGLSSGYLPSILTGGCDAERAWVVSSWVPGVSLDDFLGSMTLPPDDGLRVLRTLAQALASLHGHGMVHGDLDARVVRLTLEGDIFLVGYLPAKLRARATYPPPELEVLRNVPPERHGSAALLPAGDVYSLGLLSYQLFTGKVLLPPATADQHRANQARLQELLQKVPSVAKGLPQGLAPLLHAMLQADPARRPRSGLEVLAALTAIMPTRSQFGPVRIPLEARFAGPVAQRARAQLNRAHKALDEDRPLEAASALQQLGEVAPLIDRGLVPEVIDLLHGALWTTFLGDEGEEDRTPGYRALGLQLMQVAEGLEVHNLAELCANRLRTLTPDEGPLDKVLPPPVSRPAREIQTASWVTRLAEDSHDKHALLALAVLDDPRGSRAGGIPGVKARLLKAHGFYKAALVQKAQELTRRGGDPAVLAEIDELSKLAAASPAVPTPAPPPAAEPVPDTVVGASDLDEALSAPPGLTDSLLAWAEKAAKAESEPGTSAIHPDAPAPRRGTVPPTRSAGKTYQDAEILLSKVEVLVDVGKLLEALDALREILRGTEIEQERFFHAISAELRRILWAGLAGERPPAFLDTLFQKAREMARALDRPLLALACGYFVGADDAAAGHEPTGAEVEAAMADWEEAQVEISRSLDPADGMARCAAFLRDHPRHPPAVETMVSQARRAGDREREAEARLQVGIIQLVRGERTQARDNLRDAVRIQFENDEAMLLLAALGSLPPDRPAEPWAVRVLLLRRERLHEAAAYHLRKELRGEPGDVPLLLELAQIARDGQLDPAGHLLELGALLITQGRFAEAREHLDQALLESHDRNALVEQLRAVPGVDSVYSPSELDFRRR